MAQRETLSVANSSSTLVTGRIRLRNLLEWSIVWVAANDAQDVSGVFAGGVVSGRVRGHEIIAAFFGISLNSRQQRMTVLMQVQVRDNNVDQALRALKKKLQREGVFREMKLRQHYEKPSEKRARQRAEALRRARKLARKRAQREDLL